MGRREHSPRARLNLDHTDLSCNRKSRREHTLKVVRQNSVSIPSVLTPERALKLRSVMKAEGLDQHGRSRSAGENARAVLQLRLVSPGLATGAGSATRRWTRMWPQEKEHNLITFYRFASEQRESN